MEQVKNPSSTWITIVLVTAILLILFMLFFGDRNIEVSPNTNNEVIPDAEPANELFTPYELPESKPSSPVETRPGTR